MRIALYARVSTQDQHPDAQLHPLREYAQRRGAEAIEFVDHGVSGRKDRREALDRLAAAANREQLDTRTASSRLPFDVIPHLLEEHDGCDVRQARAACLGLFDGERTSTI